MIKASQWVTATISLMVMSVLSPGLAQTAQQLVEVCESEEGRILPDQQIVSCSVAIYARPGVDGLALIFYNRGIAYFAKGNLDAAITNFTEAIRLDQKFAIAYYNRGVTYVKKAITTTPSLIYRKRSSSRTKARRFIIAVLRTSPKGTQVML